MFILMKRSKEHLTLNNNIRNFCRITDIKSITKNILLCSQCDRELFDNFKESIIGEPHAHSKIRYQYYITCNPFHYMHVEELLCNISQKLK